MAHEEPKPDVQTVLPDGSRLAPLPDGMRPRDAVTHVDARGTVCEIFDPRWDWHDDPVVFVYMFTIRPGWAKGWGLHKRHDDRYFILSGELEVVLFDDRPESPTRNLVASVVLSGYRRQLLNIPAGVWHADRNLGDTDAIVVNLPTIQYDHAAPDKYRLPLRNDYVPYTFPPEVQGY